MYLFISFLQGYFKFCTVHLTMLFNYLVLSFPCFLSYSFLSVFNVYVCVCQYMEKDTHLSMHIWRREIRSRYCPISLSIIFTETRYIIKSNINYFGQPGWSASTWDPLFSSQTLSIEVRVTHTRTDFLHVLNTQPHISILIQKAFYIEPTPQLLLLFS